MAWFKVDDKLAFHPKTLAAGNAAIGLWIRAGSWSRAQQTNGHIPKTMIHPLGGKPADAKRLVDCGLWETDQDGYQFHDWHDYQPTEEEEAAARANRSDRGALGAHRRWHRDQPSPDCPYCTVTNGY
ncbi:MAG: hypothetical protein J2P17_08245 [Mycobacterium sp.]|nr:hypothetical protein [Mycobacterium sp.]